MATTLIEGSRVRKSASPASQAPDAPVVLVGNPGAGADRRDAAFAAALGVLATHRRPCVRLQPAESGELPGLARRAVRLATDHGGCVVAAGGDGTVATLAQALLVQAQAQDGAVTPALGVLPLGTFNYFARSQGLPDDPAEAARVWVAGHRRPVQVGHAGDRVFLVHAALGLYPQMLVDREVASRQAGRRSRALALWTMVRSLVARDTRLDLAASRDGELVRLRASTLFLGNCRLQLERIGSAQAASVDDGWLAMLWMRPVPVWERLWVALRGAAGGLAGADAIVEDRVRSLTVTPLGRRGRSLTVALDGEVVRLASPLTFRAQPQALALLCPAQQPA
jgi:diacylglycerol kinase family enzyme